MPIVELQKKTAQAIVNIFETGKVAGDYGAVTLLAGDTGHLTYGRSQTTLASGNLFLLLKAYIGAAGAALAGPLIQFLPRVASIDLSLDHDAAFKQLLRDAGDDPVMHEVQDRFFDRVYWQPAESRAAQLKLKTALAHATIYDSQIHGSLGRIVTRTLDQHGTVTQLGERAWVAAYVGERRAWLANHANALLHKTVYRMDALRGLIADAKWDLPLPLVVRGRTIDESTLAGAPLRVSAEEGVRLLRLTQPLLHGDDVKALQRALKRVADKKLEVDGFFGPATQLALMKYQRDQGMTVDGVAGPVTRAKLKLAT